MNGGALANFEFDALKEAVRYREALLREFSPYLKGDVLEAGAGIGQFTQMLQQLEAVKFITAVEPDAQFHAAFTSALPKVKLVHGVVDALAADAEFDGIVSVNVMEHIEDDAKELRNYAERLRARKGALCIFVPARPEIYAPLDKDFGHFRRYTREELSAKLRNAGFRIERLHYYNFIGYFAWWINFCLLQRRTFKTSSVKFFDRMIFPVGNCLETKVCRPPFGQSLIAICRAGAGS